MAAAVAAVFAVSCANGPKVKVNAERPTQGEIDTVSYLIGVNFGSFIKGNNFASELNELSMADIKRGMEDFIKAEGNPYNPEFAKQFAVNLDEMGMVISVGEGVEVTSVTYTDALGRVITHTVEEGNLVAKNGYYLVIGVSAAYIDNIMTITVDGATGTYCLGKYIVNQPGVAIAEAIYKYAVAAENFKNIVKE